MGRRIRSLDAVREQKYINYKNRRGYPPPPLSQRFSPVVDRKAITPDFRRRSLCSAGARRSRIVNSLLSSSSSSAAAASLLRLVMTRKSKLCSYGLLTVGGTTRIISVPRHATFQEVKKKVGGILVLKYQLVPGDLDDGPPAHADAGEARSPLPPAYHHHHHPLLVTAAILGSCGLSSFHLLHSSPTSAVIHWINGSSSSFGHLHAINGIVHHHSSSILSTINDPLLQRYIDASLSHSQSHRSSSSFTCSLPRPCCDICGHSDDQVDLGLGDACGPFTPTTPLFLTLW
ncbi:hypothetical protein ACLOJK_016984 [Asimina triloba]